MAINRTLIEVAPDTPNAPESLRQLGATLLQVNHRHERPIDGLLVLASSDQLLTEHRPVDLGDIARHATCHLLRRSFRDEAGKPRKETLANLSALPSEAIDALRKVFGLPCPFRTAD